MTDPPTSTPVGQASSGAGAITTLGAGISGQWLDPNGGNSTTAGTTERELLGTSTQNASLPSEPTGVPKLDALGQFIGTMALLAFGNPLVLADIGSGLNTTLDNTANGGNTGGSPRVSAHSAPPSFNTDPPPTGQLLTQPHT